MKSITSYVLIAIAAMALYSCGADNSSRSFNVDNPNLRAVEVQEVIQTTSYTYLKMKEELDVYWGAIPRNETIVEGNTYYFDNWMEMKNFPSKELDRTFESIYFIQTISDKPFAANQQMHPGQRGSASVGNMEIESVEPAEGGITIAELYANLDSYDGEWVTIRGEVVKYTAAVMNMNWAHIQDGSSHGGSFDLTVTTTDEVSTGDIATFRGKVVLDKDFGHGYAYDVLLEESQLVEVVKHTTIQ